MNTKEFAEKYFNAEDEAWYKGNFTLLDELEDPKLVIHMPPPLPDLVGHESHKQDIMGRRQNVLDYKQEWQYLLGEKNIYAVSLKSNFRNSNNKKVSTTRLCVGRLKKGKLFEGWVDGSTTIIE